MSDVVVIGGGVIGLSIAYELAGQGGSVTVLEQGQFGREASWAGAGILPPGNPKFARSPEARLRAASHVLWPNLSAQLREETGIDSGYFNCGGIEVRLDGPTDQLQPEIEALRAEGIQVDDISLSELIEIEPALSRETVAAFRLPEKCPSVFSITGIPPPPEAITNTPLSISSLIDCPSTFLIGSGEGTTLLKGLGVEPVGLTCLMTKPFIFSSKCSFPAGGLMT